MMLNLPSSTDQKTKVDKPTEFYEAGNVLTYGAQPTFIYWPEDEGSQAHASL